MSDERKVGYLLEKIRRGAQPDRRGAQPPLGPPSYGPGPVYRESARFVPNLRKLFGVRIMESPLFFHFSMNVWNAKKNLILHFIHTDTEKVEYDLARSAFS